MGRHTNRDLAKRRRKQKIKKQFRKHWKQQEKLLQKR